LTYAAIASARFRAAVIIAATFVFAHPIAAHAKEKSSASVYVGALSLDKNLGTRQFAGGFADVYVDDKLGLHADIVEVQREENALYASVGASFMLSKNVRPKLMVGTSTDNTAILPDQFVGLTVRITPGTNSGWVMTPGIAYRHYRNGDRDTLGSLAVAKYFKLPIDSHGYYVVQGSVTTTFQRNGRAMGSGSLGLQTVRSSGVSFGVTGEAGALVRDPIAGQTGSGEFFAIRPSLSVPIVRGVEIFARAEYADTTLYTAKGGTTGVKLGF
jgi:hypothetical protein